MRKEIANRDKPKKARAKIQKSEHEKLLERADKYFSLWFRANEADEQGIVRCCTCGVYKRWKEPDGSLHTGHWQSRGLSATRFSSLNVGCQCVICNKHKEGRKADMRVYLEKRYSVEVVNQIEVLANMPNKRLNDFELVEVAKFYRVEFRKIEKQKGL